MITYRKLSEALQGTVAKCVAMQTQADLWWKTVATESLEICNISWLDKPDNIGFAERQALRRFWGALAREATRLGINKPSDGVIFGLADIFVDILPEVAVDLALRFNLNDLHRQNLLRRFVEDAHLEPHECTWVKRLSNYGIIRLLAEMLDVPLGTSEIVKLIRDNMVWGIHQGELGTIAAARTMVRRLRSQAEALDLDEDALWGTLLRGYSTLMMDFAFIVAWKDGDGYYTRTLERNLKVLEALDLDEHRLLGTLKHVRDTQVFELAFTVAQEIDDGYRNVLIVDGVPDQELVRRLNETREIIYLMVIDDDHSEEVDKDLAQLKEIERWLKRQLTDLKQ